MIDLLFFSRILMILMCLYFVVLCKGVLFLLLVRLVLYLVFSNWIVIFGWLYLVVKKRRFFFLELSLLILVRRLLEVEIWWVNMGDFFFFCLLVKIFYVELVCCIVKLFCGDEFFDFFIFLKKDVLFRE